MEVAKPLLTPGDGLHREDLEYRMAISENKGGPAQSGPKTLRWDTEHEPTVTGGRQLDSTGNSIVRYTISRKILY